MSGQFDANGNPLVGQPPTLVTDLTKTQETHPELPNSVMMNPLDIHFQRERISQMMTIADTLHKANCFGGDVQNVYQAFVKIQTGAEMNMPPMEAMNSLYIIKGKVTLWGAAVSKRIRQHGWVISYSEESSTQVKVTVTKGAESHEYTATAQQLKDLGSKAAGFALADKLRWHALARLLRFSIPEVMGNAISYIAEEMEGLPDRTPSVAKPAVHLSNAEFNPDDFGAPMAKADVAPKVVTPEPPAAIESPVSEPTPTPAPLAAKEKTTAQLQAEATPPEKPAAKPVMVPPENLAEVVESVKPKSEPLKKADPAFDPGELIDGLIADIKACTTLDDLNEQRKGFAEFMESEARGFVTDEQVRSVWLVLGDKLKEFPVIAAQKFASTSEVGKFYHTQIFDTFDHCSCPGFKYRNTCKHTKQLLKTI